MDRQVHLRHFRKQIWTALLLVLLLTSGAATATVAATNRGNFFPEQRVKTQSTQLAVDVTGGHHTAYSEVDEDGNYQGAVFYGYCMTNCAVEANWTFVSVTHSAGGPDEVSLQLDGTKPRILIRGAKQGEFGLEHPYHYLSCENTCTIVANWADSGAVAVSDKPDPYHDTNSQSYFALYEGKPRFLYRREYGLSDPDPAPPLGLYLAFCNTNCASAGNWHKQFLTPINAQLAEYPSLALDGAGRPHFALVQPGSDGYDRLFYFACSDPTCSTTAPSRELDRVGTTTGWRLRLDSAGRPRLAFRQGEVEGSANRVIYSWCDADCAGSGTWQSYALPGVPQGSLDGLQPDLLVTDTARYISYHQGSPAADGSTTFVAFLSTCTANCESPTGAVWTHQQVDTQAAMDAEFPPPASPGCPYSFWYSGYRSSLALASDGSPQLGHDAVALSSRMTSSGPEFCGETWRAARVSVPGGADSPAATSTPVAASPTSTATGTPDPSAELQKRVYLPAVFRASSNGW